MRFHPRQVVSSRVLHALLLRNKMVHDLEESVCGVLSDRKENVNVKGRPPQMYRAATCTVEKAQGMTLEVAEIGMLRLLCGVM